MNKARLIITAINVEKISQAEAARRYGDTDASDHARRRPRNPSC